MDTAAKAGLDASKTTSKILVHKTGESIEELIWNKISEKFLKTKSVPNENSRNVEEIVTPAEKRQDTKRIKASVIKWNTTKYLNYWMIQQYQTFWQWTKVKDLSNNQYSTNKNIRLKIPTLRSVLYDYYDVNIVVKRTINLLLAVTNDNDKAWKDVAFKIKALFRWCI